MIDENKLITELKSWADRLNGGVYTEDVFKLCLTMVVKKIEDEYIRTCGQKWIPCLEKMPETGEDGFSEEVLCTVDFEGVNIQCVAVYDSNMFRWYSGTQSYFPADVYAWMPLPEIYKPESKETGWKTAMMQDFVKVE